MSDSKSPKQTYSRKSFKGVSKSDEKTLSNALQGLRKATASPKVASRVAKNKDTIGELLNSLNTRPKFTKMVEYSVQCLSNLAVGPNAIEEMIEEGVLDTLKRVLSLNPYNETIQTLINKTLEKFCATPELAAKVASVMGPGSWVMSMKKHVQEDTVKSTCSVSAKILSMTRDQKDVVDGFVKAGVVPALSHVVSTGLKKPSLLEGSVECLDRISEVGVVEYASAIFETGVVTNVLHAMTEHTDNEKLIYHAVGLVGNLANASQEIAQSLKKMGVVDILINVLEMFPDNIAILERGRNALAPLASGDDMSSSLKVIVGDNLATARAISKISTLLLVPENVDYLFRNGGVEWMFAAIQASLGKEGEVAKNIVLAGARALQRMALDEKKIYKMMQHGAVPLLVSILKAHGGDVHTVVASLRACGNMITRKENAMFELKSGVVEASFAAVKRYPDSEAVAAATLDIIQRMAAHPECIPGLVAKGAIGTVFGILERHKNKVPICMSALACLGVMAVTPDLMRQIASFPGGLDACVSVLREHKMERALCERDLVLLSSCAILPDQIEPLQGSGTVEAVLGVLEGQPELYEVAAPLLARIAGEAQLRNAIAPVKALVEKLQAHPELASTILPQLIPPVGLLCNLAMVDRNLEFLIKGGAMDVLLGVVQAVSTLPTSSERQTLLSSASQGILRLMKHPEARTALLGGSLESLLKLAVTEAENEALAEMAMQLLTMCLASSPDALPPLTVEQIIAIAKAHPLNEKIMTWAVQALAVLAVDESILRRIMAAGGEEVLLEAVFGNMDKRDLLLTSLGLLDKLASLDEASTKALIQASALDAAIEVIRKNPVTADLHKASVHLLSVLTYSEPVAIQLAEKGAIELLLNNLKRDPVCRDEKLCEWEMVLLDSLASIESNLPRFLGADQHRLAEIGLEGTDVYKTITWSKNRYIANVNLVEAADRIIASLRTREPPKPKPKVKPALAPLPLPVVVTLLPEPEPEPEPEPLTEQERMRMLRAGSQLTPATARDLLDHLAVRPDREDDRKSRVMAIKQLLLNRESARMLLEAGVGRKLGGLMRESKDDEKLFVPAAKAFLRLLDGDASEGMMDDDAVLELLMLIGTASERLAHALDIPTLTQALKHLAKHKLTPAQVQMLQPLVPHLFRMLVHTDDPLLLTTATQLLAKLSNMSDLDSLLMQLASIRELIQAMRRNFTHQEFLQYGVYLLGNLSQNEALKAEIGAEGGVQLIIQIMEAYPKNIALIDSCAFALANCSFNSFANCNFVIACHGIELVLNCLREYSNSPAVLENLIVVIINLCQHSEHNKGRIVELGGAPLIVECSLHHFKLVDLQMACFRALGSLAYDKKHAGIIIEAGAGQSAVAGLTANPEDIQLVDVTIRLLTNLSADPGERGMEILAQDGAVQATVEAALLHISHLDIEAAILGCLNNLAAYKFNAEMIVAQSGVEATVSALKSLDLAPLLVDRATRLLLQLSVHDELHTRMFEAKVPAALVTIMKAHSKQKAVIGRSLQTITNMCYSLQAAIDLTKEGFVPLVLVLTKTHLADASIIPECARCLGALSRHEEAAIMATQISPTLEQIFSTHIRNAKVVGAMMQMLANLCTHESVCDRFIDSPVLGQAIVALQPHTKDLHTILKTFAFLRNIAVSSKKTRDYCLKEGVPMTVKAVLNENVGIVEIRRAGEEILLALEAMEFAVFAEGPMQMAISKPKSLQADSGEADEKEATLDEQIRNMLQSGAVMLKHSNTAPSREKHVFVDSLLKNIMWRDLHDKHVEPRNIIKATTVSSIDKGLSSKALQRKRFGKAVADADRCFTIRGRHREVSLELPSEVEREKWVHALETLVTFQKSKIMAQRV